MIKIFKLFFLQIVLIIMLVGNFQLTEGGMCWRDVIPIENNNTHGKCKRNHGGIGIEKDDCCSSRKGYGWTSYEVEHFLEIRFINELSGREITCEICTKPAPSCDGVNCRNGRQCQMVNGKPRCLCSSDCTSTIQGPVCGYDAVQYRSECHLNRRNCHDRTFVEIDYTGQCKKFCSEVTCTDHKYCDIDLNGFPHCVPCRVESSCTKKEMRKICGSDNVTYKSFCHLLAASCEKRAHIDVLYYAQCKGEMPCNRIRCQRGETCLIDHETKYPICTDCQHYCLSRYKLKGPVCSNNDQTFENWCFMQEESCNEGILYKVKQSGACNDPPEFVPQMASDHYEPNVEEEDY